jgi:hypothetical protein
MMISDEQADMAAQQMASSTHKDIPVSAPSVDPEVIERARVTALLAPDAREDRIIQAKARLLVGLPTSHDIASMMVSRIVSDSLR